MDQTYIKAITTKYFEGRISPIEESTLVKWLLEKEENYMFFVGQRSEFEKNGNCDFQTEMAWERIEERMENSRSETKLRLFRNFKRVASIAAVLLIGIFVWQSELLTSLRYEDPITFHELSSLKGHKSKVVLPDGTQVWLNSNSSLKYASDFANKHRTVYLEGEGFFDVVKNKDLQFSVVTKDLDVKVYGTAFNVNAYGEAENVEVALLRGSVKVASGTDKSKLTELRPGEGAFYNKENQSIVLRNINVENEMIWTKSKLIFQNQSLKELVEKLERWYGVQIELKGNFKNSQKYNFTLKTESLREMLELISLITPIKYTITNGDEVLIKPKY